MASQKKKTVVEAYCDHYDYPDCRPSLYIHSHSPNKDWLLYRIAHDHGKDVDPELDAYHLLHIASGKSTALPHTLDVLGDKPIWSDRGQLLVKDEANEAYWLRTNDLKRTRAKLPCLPEATKKIGDTHVLWDGEKCHYSKDLKNWATFPSASRQFGLSPGHTFAFAIDPMPESDDEEETEDLDLEDDEEAEDFDEDSSLPAPSLIGPPQYLRVYRLADGQEIAKYNLRGELVPATLGRDKADLEPGFWRSHPYVLKLAELFGI